MANVQIPTPGRVVLVYGPGVNGDPAMVVRVVDRLAAIMEVVVFHGGFANVGYLEHIAPDNITIGTLPHRSTREEAPARVTGGRPTGPCYWLWPTEAA
jgi:hypothetical protein